jgi:xylulokinase
MSILLDRPVIHPQLLLGFHVISNHWLLQGGTLNWFNRHLGFAEQQLGREQVEGLLHQTSPTLVKV